MSGWAGGTREEGNRNRSGAACAASALLMVLLALGGTGPVAAAPGTTWVSVIEENDAIITHHDRHYTQGLRITALFPQPAQDGWIEWTFEQLGRVLPMYRADSRSRRHLEWQVLGQSLFTPTQLHVIPPPSNDRPYAGWLYTGVDFLQENDGHSLHDLEVTGGVVGPAALAREAQDMAHDALGFSRPDGYSYQLGNRAAVQFSYQYLRRFDLQLGRNYGLDVVPSAGLTLGSVMRDVEAGALLRFGNALRADYGPERIRPSLSGTGWFDESRLGAAHFHFYFFGGAQLRLVQYNRLIDGADEVQPVGLDRETKVIDVLAGGSIMLRHGVRADFSAVRRSREFSSQGGEDVFGSARLTIGF